MAVSKEEEARIAEIREAAEADLETFITLVAKGQVLGDVHREWCRWATDNATSNHQLTLLPRDHQKSRLVAYKAAWWITKFPWVRILYISSTSGLAEKQLKFIKDILTNSVYRRYWPEMVNENEGKREKWTNTEIAVDHPARKAEAVRDSTVFTGGLTTSLTGFHCDIAILDDVVVYENAYTEDGREKVHSQYSLISSIEGTEAQEWVVGTRYHPKDLYSNMIDMEEDTYDENGELSGSASVYEVFQREVEDRGDGTGTFLWPIQVRSDGKRFGFDAAILAKKRAKYLDRTQFRAQYYNDPNDPGNMRIDRSKFQYYDPRLLTHTAGIWFYKDRRLNVFASVDFAYSLSKRADSSCIAVIGVDRENNTYILEIDRFKEDKTSGYFKHILDLHTKWGFRKLGAECTSAQSIIVRELKDNYIRPNGLFMSVEELRPTRHSGSKEERIAAILEPRYDNLQMWHYKGGHCQTLEEELVSQHPAHDDCMDALAACVSIAVPPSGMQGRDRARTSQNVIYSKFGGLGGDVRRYG